MATDWRLTQPVLSRPGVTLRALTADDAASLNEAIGARARRYIAAAPESEEGYRGFIRWSVREYRRGAAVCYGVVPNDAQGAVGLFQARPIEPDYSVSEWGVVIGERYWGTGLFEAGARLFLDFLVHQVGARRLEARAVAENARGNAAIRKLGARPEGMLRAGFQAADGRRHDHVMWAILASEWDR